MLHRTTKPQKRVAHQHSPQNLLLLLFEMGNGVLLYVTRSSGRRARGPWQIDPAPDLQTAESTQTAGASSRTNLDLQPPTEEPPSAFPVPFAVVSPPRHSTPPQPPPRYHHIYTCKKVHQRQCSHQHHPHHRHTSIITPAPAALRYRRRPAPCTRLLYRLCAALCRTSATSPPHCV